MVIHARIALFMNQFVATLSNGQRVERSGLDTMADALHRAGVPASAVTYEWRAGLQMITAGKQVALRAAIRQCEEQSLAFLSRREVGPDSRLKKEGDGGGLRSQGVALQGL